jgi:hypothetical protein
LIGLIFAENAVANSWLNPELLVFQLLRGKIENFAVKKEKVLALSVAPHQSHTVRRAIFVFLSCSLCERHAIEQSRSFEQGCSRLNRKL